MYRSLVPAVAAGLLLIGGCAGGPQSSADTRTAMLTEARDAIAQNRTALGVQRIAEARQLAQDDGASTKEADLLLAEVHLRQQRTDEAMEIAEAVLHDHPDDARASEVYAKALIQSGDFQAARSHLEKARAGYTDDSDLRRVEDLTYLVDGLDAYAEGRHRAAQEHWERIQDPVLRRSLTRSGQDAI